MHSTIQSDDTVRYGTIQSGNARLEILSGNARLDSLVRDRVPKSLGMHLMNERAIGNAPHPLPYDLLPSVLGETLLPYDLP